MAEAVGCPTMPFTFNALLHQAGIDPKSTLLLRHQDNRAQRGRSIYRLWRDDRPAFEDYQSRQKHGTRRRLDRSYWASFVATPTGDTLFAGLYGVGAHRQTESDWVAPHSGITVPAGFDNVFDLRRVDALHEFEGVLYIDWGAGMRSWVQRAEKQDKAIIELRREIQEAAFPGYSAFIAQLSELETLAPTWVSPLTAAKGVYLLTCPRTDEQYVGAAVGSDGFFGRWLEYARTGHGGNVALKSRNASDYRVSILEVAGFATSVEDVYAMEARWKAKLQSREMGLNRN